jgi:hypothetical protein
VPIEIVPAEIVLLILEKQAEAFLKIGMSILMMQHDVLTSSFKMFDWIIANIVKMSSATHSH